MLFVRVALLALLCLSALVKKPGPSGRRFISRGVQWPRTVPVIGRIFRYADPPANPEKGGWEKDNRRGKQRGSNSFFFFLFSFFPSALRHVCARWGSLSVRFRFFVCLFPQSPKRAAFHSYLKKKLDTFYSFFFMISQRKERDPRFFF